MVHVFSQHLSPVEESVGNEKNRRAQRFGELHRMDKVGKLVEEIEQRNNPEELTALAVHLNNFRERLQVRSMGIAEQRNACCAAMLAKDKTALRKFLQSQFEEIHSWARENLTPPGPPQWPRIDVN